MTKRNWGLLIILFILIGVLGVLISRTENTGSGDVEADLFAVKDTSAIQRIELIQQGGSIQLLERSGRGWSVNGKHAADNQIMKLMLSVLRNAEVKRPVSRSQQQEVIEQLKQEGTAVRIYHREGMEREFHAGGSEQRQISYFMQNGQAFVVELPGYANYVSGIFSLSASNLRDRTIFKSNYLTLKEVQVQYPDSGEEVKIRFDRNQLEVEGVSRPDSAQLLGFLSLLENFQAVGYVNAREYPELDSMLSLGHIASVRVINLQNPEGRLLELYSTTPDNRYRLGWLPQEEQAVMLDERLARMLLIDKEQLRSKEE